MVQNLLVESYRGKKYFQRSVTNLTRWYSGDETKEEEDEARKKIANNLVSADDHSMPVCGWLTVCAEGDA